MRVRTDIRLESINYPKKRTPLNPKALLFALKLLQGHTFPPVHVERNPNGSFSLLSGRHRFAAHKLLGRKTISAILAIRQEPYPYKPLVVRETKHYITTNLDNRVEVTPVPKE